MTFDQRSDFTLVVALPGTNGALVEPDADPVLRLYGDGGLVASPAVEPLQQADITDVDPITGGSTLTAAGHPFQVGDVIRISGVAGATGVNGVRTVIGVTADTFGVGVAPGGTYAGGGEAASVGLYKAACDADVRASLEPGRAYTAVWRWAVANAPAAHAQTFAVV